MNTLAERITAILTGTGFRPESEMPFSATHHSGPFFTVTQGVGATVGVAWMDATGAERGALLHRFMIRLHECGLDAEWRDSYLYVSEAAQSAGTEER